MTKPHKSIRRGSDADSAPPESAHTRLCAELLEAIKKQRYEQFDELMRHGLAKATVQADHLKTLTASPGSAEALAWSELTSYASERLRYGRPESQLAMSGWQIAAWCDMCNSEISDAWLQAARKACMDIMATSLDARRPLGLVPNPKHDDRQDLELPPGIYLLRFSREGNYSNALPGLNLETILPNPDNLTFNESTVKTFAQRTSPNVLIEATNYSEYDDDNYHPGCAGVAYFSEEPQAIDAFIESRPSLTFRESLFERAARGSLTVLDEIDNGIPVDLSTNWRPGVSRLIHRACNLANGKLVDGLLSRGAYPNRREEEWVAPIYELFRFAIQSKESETEMALRSLIAHGLDFSGIDFKQHGEMPLHKAARNDWPVIAATLLNNGADPNALDEQGLTPIGIAKDRLNRTNMSDCAALFDAWHIRHKIQDIRSKFFIGP